MFAIAFTYFDAKGNQEYKMLERDTLKRFISALLQDLENKELYEIKGVTRNLKDYDFTKHGIYEYKFF